jgi:hypothetical protein
VSNTSKPQSQKERKEKKCEEGGEGEEKKVNFGAEAFLFQAAITGSDLNILRRELCELRFSTFCAIPSNFVYSSLDI